MVSKSADITGGIVVGHDGSRVGTTVVRRAADLARRLGVTLHVIRVWSVTTAPRPDSMVGGYVPPFAEFERAVIADLEDDCAAAGIPDDVDVQLYALRGQATERLVAAAADAEMLVVGTRGAGGFAGLRFGSTAAQVVRASRVPVLVVPNVPD
ncbi:universal stress protein [Nocardioides sp. zg-1228]|uniref:universal stress protein n=1 Tax=Nocardioides sp. zg-1228 TaxID=2763008 RepID=UPI0016434CCC|nr:universal stress protein [Nocardioides sp. zg-1228]MBC2932202.1 universal stress protein [Nocardioides sp. zg-1228]QSF57735.1 universal stress protein [Nocardioides sp. zg-1228]